jgi:hypothetical protein
MQLTDLIWGAAGFLLTIMVFSYLIGDNPLFRIAAYLFIGIASGYIAVLMLYQVIWPKLILPLFNGMEISRILNIVPLILTLLLFAKLSSRFGRLGNISIGFLVGAGAAIVIGGAILGTLIPQSLASINAFNLTMPGALQNSILTHLVEGFFLLIATTSTLLFFFYGDQSQHSLLKAPWQFIQVGRQVGKYFIAITLGAVYAGVMSASVAALVERVSSLWTFISQWLV